MVLLVCVTDDTISVAALHACRDEVQQSQELSQHLSHPAVVRLRSRLQHLLTPSSAPGDTLLMLDTLPATAGMAAAGAASDQLLEEHWRQEAAGLAHQGKCVCPLDLGFRVLGFRF